MTRLFLQRMVFRLVVGAAAIGVLAFSTFQRAGSAPGVFRPDVLLSAQGSPPHIVMIMVDDLSVVLLDYLRANNRLPQFEDIVAEHSTEFRQAFATNPLCCPSRATFLTGKYSHNTGTWTNLPLNGMVVRFDPSATVATALQAAGYRTAHVGKYLNGYGTIESLPGAARPDARLAWDARVGLARRLTLEGPYVPPGWTEWRGILDPTTYCMYNNMVNENGTVRLYQKNGQIFERTGENPFTHNTQWKGAGQAADPAEHYQTDLVTRFATDIIDDHADLGGAQSLFLQIAPLAPHVEKCEDWSNQYFGDDGPTSSFASYQAQYDWHVRAAPRHGALPLQTDVDAAEAFLRTLPNFNEDISDKPGFFQGKTPLPMSDDNDSTTYDEVTKMARQFASMVNAMKAVDDLVAAVKVKLAERGMLADTIVVFTSDNGWQHGQHRLSGKLLAYEESARIPLFIAARGAIANATPAPADSVKMVLNNDVAATIAAWGGTSLVGADGVSLVPLLSNPSIAWRKRALLEHYASDFSAADPTSLDQPTMFAVRTSLGDQFPLRTFVEYYDRVRLHQQYVSSGYQAGWYACDPAVNPPGCTAGSPQLIPGTSEFYDLNQGPFQLTNFLWTGATSAQQTQAATEAYFSGAFSLKNRLLALITCAGTSGAGSCFAAEF